MTLYIGNVTRQEFDLNAMLPELSRNFRRVISSGKQLEVQGLTESQENALVSHLVRYGAVKRSDLHGKLDRFTGWVYSEKPLKMEEFHYGLEEVLNTAENRSVTQATKSAIASHNAVAAMSKATEIEMEEEHAQKGKKGRKMKLTVDPSLANSDNVPLQ